MTTNTKKEYMRNYRKHRVHKMVVFSKSEYALLSRSAQKNNTPFSSFVRNAALAHVSTMKVYPVPEKLKKVELLLIRYGTNLNQLAFIANGRRNIDQKTIEAVQTNFAGLDKDIRSVYHAPLDIEKFIRSTIQNHPGYKIRIEAILKEFE